MRKPSLKGVPRLDLPARTPLAELEVVLITRLFGGGAHARKIDEVSWLRPAALKSALRFWWRAGHAHLFTTPNELLGAEKYLFGASATFGDKGRIQGGPGALSVEVDSGPIAKRVYGAVPGEGPGNPLTVAYFPARGEADGTPARELGLTDARAKLALFCSSLKKDDRESLLSALRLWLILGGVGARTRRGAGAIEILNLEIAASLSVPRTVQQLEAFLREQCLPRPGAPAFATFSLSQTLQVFLGRLCRSGEQAQKDLLAVFKSVRQNRKPGTGNRPGRSNWPEPNAIRLLFDAARLWRHKPDPGDAGRYPRAALGLPIVMKFQDDPPLEPPRHTVLARLQAGAPECLQRYASPILLRSVQVWEQGRKYYVPVALVTRGTLPTTAIPVVTGPGGEAPIPSYVKSRQSDAIQKVLDAFRQAPGFRNLP